MKQKSIKIIYHEFANAEELKANDRKLLLSARKAAKSAYAPYSQFQVGAAVLLANGKIIIGNNQENAAYPSGLCAERVALFSAAAQFPGVPVTALAITALSKNFHVDFPLTPCGACRQVMAEYENLHQVPLRLVLSGESGKILVLGDVASVLPLMFNSKQLRKKK
jgi:cytidine deaminase